MFRGTKIALAVAAILAGAASVVMASDWTTDDRGGFVMPGSLDGVNPAYHPEFFGSPPNIACVAHFKTYDLQSETYIGSDGHRHSCRRP